MNPHAATRDPTRRFSDRADFYVRSRPKYPQALLDFCRNDLGLRPQSPIADVGSGTGFLSELFVQNGNPVFAVEPNADMRSSSEKLLGNRPNFHSINGTAEATGLSSGSVDFVVAGQAFHWFDPPRAREEFRRILIAGGWTILVWNERRDQDGFAQDYKRITTQFSTEPQSKTSEARTPAAMAQFFAPATYKVATFSNHQPLDLNGLLERALSSSNLPLPDQPGCEEMLDSLRQAFSRHAADGQVWLHYDTNAYYGQIV